MYLKIKNGFPSDCSRIPNNSKVPTPSNKSNAKVQHKCITVKQQIGAYEHFFLECAKELNVNIYKHASVFTKLL
ncbi:hypothetical protein OsJ_18821 [Oryza sativa Japonica Group]|uniref:Uncharacterized protein n=1 Tax=Oryza sativa subsp. japonica TaxID=39947 RepID=B9FKM1_ORYSJ|nr:hypothetical protein OsJ_18821 [Oryza sativa Japonica Group]